jgi:predicted DNA-binding transcriptional regulator AlpA
VTAIDPTSETFRPLTLDEVLEITGRSRRTITRWISTKRLTPYEEKHRRTVVFNEDQVIEIEKSTLDAQRQGRPPKRPETTSPTEGVDAGQNFGAS